MNITTAAESITKAGVYWRKGENQCSQCSVCVYDLEAILSAGVEQFFRLPWDGSVSPA